MTELSIDQQIATFLAVCRTASLATVDTEGLPCAANVQYVNDDAWRLFWVSKAASAHSLNVTDKPQGAVTIYAHQDTPEMIHGLQIRGEVSRLEGQAVQDALALYTTKYPFVAGPPFAEVLQKQDFYCLTPMWLRWIDNRRGFGWKREIQF